MHIMQAGFTYNYRYFFDFLFFVETNSPFILNKDKVSLFVAH